MVKTVSTVQKEFLLVKPARDAALKAKMEAEASSSVTECPLHLDNEWEIRYSNYTVTLMPRPSKKKKTGHIGDIFSLAYKKNDVHFRGIFSWK